MAVTFLSLISLFISCFILLLGNGLINVLLPVRMELQGLGADTIGMVLSLYYVGMLTGAVYSKHLIKRAGHIRLFAGSVALGAVSILFCSFDTNPILWGLMRMVLGFCNACAYSAMESWLSDSSTKESRGKVLAAYNAVVLGGLFGGQFFLNIASPQDSTLFVLGGALLCLSIIPLALSKNAGPVIGDVVSMSIFSLYRKSPLGVVCCIVGGLIYAALFNMLPVFAKTYQIVDFELTLYMGAAILGAFLLQFPVGYLSDKFDRRTVMFMLLVVSATVSVAASLLAPLQWTWPLFLATGITTGIIACLYPLSISEAFDKLKQTEMVAAMGSMILAFSLGGVLGPYSASLVMDIFGNKSLFYFLALIQLMLAAFVAYRMKVREALPVDKQESFVMQGAATSAAMVELDPRTEYLETELIYSPEAQTAIEIAQTDQGAAVNMARAIAVSQPEKAVEMASALASVNDIDVLRLYEVMQKALPYRIMEIARAIVKTKPDLAYELVQKLAQSHPEQVVSVAAEIGHEYPELRVSMAKVAVEFAPESAVKVAGYYAQVVAEERDSMRPADSEDDTSEQDVLDIAAELWEVSPEDALDVAATLAEAVPESAVPFATELASNMTDGSIDDEAVNDIPITEAESEEAVNLVQRLADAAPENTVDVAIAVAEALPQSAVAIASEVAGNYVANNDYDTAALEEAGDVSPVVAGASNSDEESRNTASHEPSQASTLEADAAVDLMQRLAEVSPDTAVDVAVAVAEALPQSVVAIATEVAGGFVENPEVEAETDLGRVDTTGASSAEVVDKGEAQSDVEYGEMEQDHQYALEAEAAVDLVQRLTEVAPNENVLDIAAAVIEVVPESAAIVASEVMTNLTDNSEESLEGDIASAVDSDDLQSAYETDTAIDVITRLSQASPDNALEMAVAIVESVPESASHVMDVISEGKESSEGEWMNDLDANPQSKSAEEEK